MKVFFLELKIVGALSTTPKSWELAESLGTQGRINLSPLITRRFPLSEWEKAYQMVESGTGCKILLIP